jgi:IS5 family transposase
MSLYRTRSPWVCLRTATIKEMLFNRSRRARPVPDATTLLKFRRLLLDNDLTKALFEEINAHLA